MAARQGDVDDGLSEETTPNAVREKLNNASASISAAGTQDRSVNDVGAYIDDEAQITVGNNLTVEATETVTFNGISGSVAGGSFAVGGSVTSLKVQTVTEAFIDDGAVIAVGGDLTVRAYASETGDILSFAGTAALTLSLGIQYSEALISSNQTALINSNVQVVQADALAIEAGHLRDMDTNATGGSIAAVGIGVSQARADLTGTVEAGLGSNSRLGTIDSSGDPNGTIGSLKIDAFSEVTQAKAEANSGAAGVAPRSVPGTKSPS